MSGRTNIEWATDQWNPVVGCSVVSPGCTNCYAMRMAGTRLRKTAAYRGLTQETKAGPVWNGMVRLLEDRLDDPRRWRVPKDGSRRRVFVNSMGDLFHEAMPDNWIVKVWCTMVWAHQHDFLVLTKRPARMRAYASRFSYPPKNIWLGVSAEDQTRADERIPLLLDTQAAVRFVSAEPLLWPINLDPNWALDWVIVGGESGPNARPMHPDWARSLRDQCVAAGTPFFFKQWGGLRPKSGGRLLDEREWNEMPRVTNRGGWK